MVEKNQPAETANDELEFDYYLQFEWPEHIETAIRRLLWISLVETANGDDTQAHTSFVRKLIATYPESPAEVLDFLATIGNAELKIRVAENRSVWSTTLAWLAQTGDSQIREAVADNPNTAIDTLISLCECDDVDVRYSMAENPALPAKLLNKLAADENCYVCVRAKRTLARRSPTVIEQFPRRQADNDRKRKLG